MQPANDHPSVLSKLAKNNRIHLQRISIVGSPVFTPQEVRFGQLTAVVGSHGAGKTYLLKILEESLPKYGGEHMRFPPASRSRWKEASRAEVGAVAGTQSIYMGSGWNPQEFSVDLAGPRIESFTFGENDEALRVTVPLSAHRAFADYEMWMQDVEVPDHAKDFEGNWSADRPTLGSINRILGRPYASVEFFTFRSDSYDAPYVEATMPDGQVRTAYEMSSGELWVLYCIWELGRSLATDIVLIDEPESYLSPRGHIAFLDEIARRTLAGGFQTIIATHSEAMIRRLPIDLLRFAVRGANGVVIRDDVTHDEVMVALGYEQSVKYLAIVEDSLGEEILRMALAFFGLDHGRSWDIVRLGGTGEARRTLTILSTMRRLVTLLVLDGDQRSDAEDVDAFFLPGGDPEMSILESCGSEAADRLGVPRARLDAAIAHTEGMVHQRIFREIAEYLGLDHAFVRRTLVASWLNCIEVREQAQAMVAGMEAAAAQ
ncbi:AAA family ATPase [Arthrobacter oryzae]|jgi:ABC-type multidrug transport system ATPase subunit|uniref:AAA family ATPase n=1 Tax=Arthrobacter oryzae TaxID=409290 RepID=UPI002787D651|nr:AAA family ATPase [Arthrobacter oryzae]MDQ0076727.1 ABC-type multidrug transport system ATPase subunit [Arthrobacter oryzae]